MAVEKYSWIFTIVCLSILSEVFGIEPRTSINPSVEFSSVGQSNIKSLNTSELTNSSISKEDAKVMIDTTTKGSTEIVLQYKLPERWSDFCEVVEGETYESEFTKTNLTSIKCVIDAEHSDIWTMTDLRKNLDQYNHLNMTFSVDIKCLSMANISLSYPFKVNNLYILKIQDCKIFDYLAESSDSILETTPDSLRVVHIWNTLNVVLLSRMIEITSNIKNVKKEYDCVHDETIEDISMRNINFDFMIDDELLLQELIERGQDFVLNTRRIQHTCDYPRLISMDESNSDSRSLYHLDLLTENAIFDHLRTFNVSNTHIKVLKDQYLQWSMTFPKLQTLDLSHNNISKLYRFAIPFRTDLDVITTINLTNNQISTITVNDLERFKMMPMVFFDLRNNPIDCNCSDTLEELLNYIKQRKHLQISNLSDYKYIENLQCNNPENLKGTTLKALTSEMICESKVQTEYFLVPIICLSTAIVILALLLFMALRFRHEITIILFTRFNIIIPCHTRDSYDSEKKYDAFVSYSSNEEEYVEKLFEDLEKPADDKSRPSFKFCMHHRDFVPGKTIFDNVTFSVESSRHTIILLSNHFIKSEYCLYEFQEAFRQSIMEKRRHLVIIMMEDIPEEKLPRDLRRCVKTFTYIRKDDFLFTERLIYALSIKHKGKTIMKSIQNDSDDRFSTGHTFSTNSEPTKSKENNKRINTMDKVKNLDTEPKISKPETDNTCKIDMGNYVEFKEPSKDISIERHNKYRKHSDKLKLSIKHTNDSNLSPVERKLNNKDLDYDRSLSLISQDTGYGSDLGSICERLSPEVTIGMDAFPEEVVC